MSLSIDEQLRRSRLNLQHEVRQALMCKTKRQKIELVERWKAKYDPIYVQELLNVARNKQAAGDILAWDLNNF